jgi:hypothetical protein
MTVCFWSELGSSRGFIIGIFPNLRTDWVPILLKENGIYCKLEKEVIPVVKVDHKAQTQELGQLLSSFITHQSSC